MFALTEISNKHFYEVNSLLDLILLLIQFQRCLRTMRLLEIPILPLWLRSLLADYFIIILTTALHLDVWTLADARSSQWYHVLSLSALCRHQQDAFVDFVVSCSELLSTSESVLIRLGYFINSLHKYIMLCHWYKVIIREPATNYFASLAEKA
jgi:hypothetical protein